MTTGAKLAWGFLLLVAILHFDFWNWDDATTVWFGFLPVGLGFQAAISLAASLGWMVIMRVDWPHGVEAWADQEGMADGPDGGGH